MRQCLFLIVALIISCSERNSQQQKSDIIKSNITEENHDDYLIRIHSPHSNFGYGNLKGKVVIPFGKYISCFTDTFRTFAIVCHPKMGFVAIDRNEKVLYKIFMFDNGPDEISEGLFRIIIDGKIGYANEKGKIVIQPKFECADPFKDGKAEVSLNCEKNVIDQEHVGWKSDHWFYIDKTGNEIK
jgi:hypothetical protein